MFRYLLKCAVLYTDFGIDKAIVVFYLIMNRPDRLPPVYYTRCTHRSCANVCDDTSDVFVFPKTPFPAVVPRVYGKSKCNEKRQSTRRSAPFFSFFFFLSASRTARGGGAHVPGATIAATATEESSRVANRARCTPPRALRRVAAGVRDKITQ